MKQCPLKSKHSILQGGFLRHKVNNSEELQEVPKTEQIHQVPPSQVQTVKTFETQSQTSQVAWKKQRPIQLPGKRYRPTEQHAKNALQPVSCLQAGQCAPDFKLL